MPFRSKAQQRWMYANEPAMAERWSKETRDFSKLPEKVADDLATRLQTIGQGATQAGGIGAGGAAGWAGGSALGSFAAPHVPKLVGKGFSAAAKSNRFAPDILRLIGRGGAGLSRLARGGLLGKILGAIGMAGGGIGGGLAAGGSLDTMLLGKQSSNKRAFDPLMLGLVGGAYGAGNRRGNRPRGALEGGITGAGVGAGSLLGLGLGGFAGAGAGGALSQAIAPAATQNFLNGTPQPGQGFLPATLLAGGALTGGLAGGVGGGVLGYLLGKSLGRGANYLTGDTREDIERDSFMAG